MFINLCEAHPTFHLSLLTFHLLNLVLSTPYLSPYEVVRPKRVACTLGDYHMV